MDITVEIDEGSGFCFGVTTAIRKAEESLAHAESLYCLGDIVHNSRECERLYEMGLKTIDHNAFGRLNAAKVLLRAHGEPPETYAIARKNNIEIIDATCPVVLQLQRRIKQVYDNEPDAQIAIYGKPGHAEVLGLVGQTEGHAVVISSIDEAKTLDLTRDIRLFSQTTQPLEGFRNIVDYLSTHIVSPATFRSFDTVCRQVSNRMPNIQAFATRHDVILFVSGLKSSNGRVLFETCKRVNPRSFLVDDPSTIDRQWFENAKSVGICGATSTPKWLMEACKEQIEKL